MKAIITVIFFVLLIGALLDHFRRRGSRSQTSARESERLLSADNAPPTETGRLRVQSILEAVKQKTQVEEPEEAETIEDEKLPDPFDSGKKH